MFPSLARMQQHRSSVVARAGVFESASQTCYVPAVYLGPQFPHLKIGGNNSIHHGVVVGLKCLTLRLPTLIKAQAVFVFTALRTAIDQHVCKHQPSLALSGFLFSLC